MKRLTIAAVAVCLSGSVGFAQDPVTTNPKTYHVLLDNARVRVLHVTVPVGGKTVMHEHPENAVIVLSDSKITFTGADGKSDTIEMKTGTAAFQPAQKHAGANAGTAPIDAIVVELKGSAKPTATLPTSRANIARTTLAESPRADVVRFTADAGFKEEPKTTHDYDQVLIAPGPVSLSVEIGGKTTTTFKRGDVLFIGRGVPHQAQTTSGKPQDMIVVAVK
jgi:quercetin dioxygenase-like cupin family protein